MTGLDNFIAGVVRVVLRLALVAAAAVLAICVLFVLAVLLCLWGLRQLWARLTGRPVGPWHMGFDPGARFQQARRAYSAAGQWSPRRPEGAARKAEDVTDVVPRELP
ncbi:hypothetical protein [Xylophilus sp. ASV27]|uniref:hypothetical protein n=1 Tax=Xylophilus sp. ASV27 TaxID=2795129 RepID=UPI0018EAA526|nr:hypothetical protein [Xylophilus sp. ASV27]